MDLANASDVRRVVRDTKPDLIVNAGAFAAVDRAEEQAEQAMAVNATAPGILAEEARRMDAALVHYSTDYVFDGTGSRPYREDDAVNPINTYGRTKLACEQAVQQTDAAAVILRTGWVYGSRGRNFLLTVIRLISERDRLSIVDDQVGAPTWCRMLAEATAQILTPGMGRFAAYLGERRGVYHLSCAGLTSWHGFAQHILALSSVEDRERPIIEPIPTSAYSTPAARPAYSVLDNSRVRDTFGIHPPDWKDALDLALAD